MRARALTGIDGRSARLPRQRHLASRRQCPRGARADPRPRRRDLSRRRRRDETASRSIPVARFHLGNGASLDRINPFADLSPHGRRAVLRRHGQLPLRPGVDREEPRGLRQRRQGRRFARRFGGWSRQQARARRRGGALNDVVPAERDGKGPSKRFRQGIRCDVATRRSTDIRIRVAPNLGHSLLTGSPSLGPAGLAGDDSLVT